MDKLLASKFSQKGTIEIMLMLLEAERKTTEITSSVYPQTAYRAISILIQLGLVATKRGWGNTTYYLLTEKGRKVAKKFVEIEKILQEEPGHTN